MNKNFNASIHKSLDTLNKLDLLLQPMSITSLTVSDNFKKSSLRANVYKDIYDTAVSHHDYNLMLNDKSFFQFTTIKDNKEVRLAFYPNPYKFTEYIGNKKEIDKLLDDDEITFSEYEQLLSESNFTSDIPLIRYDLSLSQYIEHHHPAAHLHIGFKKENRWPVRRILTPYAFTLKILSHYYSDVWVNLEEKNQLKNNWFNEEYQNEIERCGIIDAEYFSKNEQKRLYMI